MYFFRLDIAITQPLPGAFFDRLAFADVIWGIPAASGFVEGRQGARLHETDADSVRRDSCRDDGTRRARLRHDGQRQDDGVPVADLASPAGAAAPWHARV